MRHGTNHAYDQGCRCDECRGFKREKDRRRRAKRKAAAANGQLEVPHGTEVGYSKYYCRCEACGDAHRVYMRDYRLSPDGQTYTRRWIDRIQVETGDAASKHGQQWTGAELEIVVTRDDLSLPDLARLLGRTHSAVANAKWRATHDPKWIKVAGKDDA